MPSVPLHVALEHAVQCLFPHLSVEGRLPQYAVTADDWELKISGSTPQERSFALECARIFAAGWQAKKENP